MSICCLAKDARIKELEAKLKLAVEALEKAAIGLQEGVWAIPMYPKTSIAFCVESLRIVQQALASLPRRSDLARAEKAKEAWKRLAQIYCKAGDSLAIMHMAGEIDICFDELKSLGESLE
jgi:hypothetical protein